MNHGSEEVVRIRHGRTGHGAECDGVLTEAQLNRNVRRNDRAMRACRFEKICALPTMFPSIWIRIPIILSVV